MITELILQSVFDTHLSEYKDIAADSDSDSDIGDVTDTNCTNSLQVYTDGSKHEDGVGSGIAVFAGSNLITTQMYRLNGRCSNNQAEQLAILEALECIQNRQDVGKTIIVYTDSRITLQLLTNRKRHTYLIDKIRMKFVEMERNELADLLAKEASISSNIEGCYNKIPKSTITKELKGQCIKQWQNEWNTTTKGATTKSFYPNIEHRLTLRVSLSPNFTTILTGHSNINSYLHKFKITQNPGCPCNKGDQTVDHIIYSCGLHEQERKRLKAAIHRSGKWPASKNTLATKYYKHFRLFTDTIVINRE